MNGIIPFPPQASAEAISVDRLYFWLVAASALVCLLVFGLLVTFATRYRAGSRVSRTRLPAVFAREIEVGWTVATLFVFLGIFWWASSVRLVHSAAPPGSIAIRVVAKQWMWKFEHPSGAREIDVLHLPLGIPAQLSMTSQDVIHSFYVPAFREKQDVLPDRVTTLWFTPDKLGRFPLRCAEYCGTDHSHMLGEVVVMAAQDYAVWSSGRKDMLLTSNGAQYFRELGCESCHTRNARRAPSLQGLFGTRVDLADGRVVVADEPYLERSILDPRADIVKGYEPVMPSYRGVVTPRQVSALIAYLKSLESKEAPP